MTTERPPSHLGWSFAVLTVAALSLAPSFAHMLEAWPRLYVWPPDLWRETTVFNQQFLLYLIVGAPLDLAAVALSAVYAVRLRTDRPKERSRAGLAVTGCVLYSLALIVWALWVAPANDVLAAWTPGPIPENFDDIRGRWESGHIVVAVLKVLGFMALSLAVALRGDHPARPLH
jgi:hypothetical protein